MKELHHIVPRCRGGTDDSDNLIWLSPRAHAIISVMQSEHYQHPCLHGRQLQFLPKELKELARHWIREMCRLGRSKQEELRRVDPTYNEAFLKRTREAARSGRERLSLLYRTDPHFKRTHLENAAKGREAAKSHEARAKLRETQKRLKHQQGHRNSQYGTMWITDGYSNQKIKRGEPIPEGFRPGRTC